MVKKRAIGDGPPLRNRSSHPTVGYFFAPCVVTVCLIRRFCGDGGPDPLAARFFGRDSVFFRHARRVEPVAYVSFRVGRPLYGGDAQEEIDDPCQSGGFF